MKAIGEYILQIYSWRESNANSCMTEAVYAGAMVSSRASFIPHAEETVNETRYPECATIGFGKSFASFSARSLLWSSYLSDTNPLYS